MPDDHLLTTDADDRPLLPDDAPDEVFLADDDYEAFVRPPAVPWDDEESTAGESTYQEATSRGPEPTPDWVITSATARDTELGVLKSGKEADVFLLERRLLDEVNLLAAKRYVPVGRRNFRNKGLYQQGRRMKDRREQRAADRKTAFGAKVGAHGWAAHEMEMLSRLWTAGVAVPYPVQQLGVELLLEFIGDDERAAPRLVETHPRRVEATFLYEQVVVLLRGLARAGIAHGDLSAYNLLVWNDRVVMIDVPQATDLAINPNALDLFRRDVDNVCHWFDRKGVDVDPDAVFNDCLLELH